MAIATTVAVSAPARPVSGGLMPVAGTNAPGLGDGFDAVFSAILSQIAGGAVGNNPPAAAISAVANDAAVSPLQPQPTNANALAIASNSDPLAAPVTAAGAVSPRETLALAPSASDVAQNSAFAPAASSKQMPVPANANAAAAAVSLLEAQAASVPTPKSTSARVAADAQHAPKQNTKTAAATTTPAPDASLLVTPVPVAPAVAPVAPPAPVAPAVADGSAALLAASAPNAAPPQLAPLDDADSDGTDDDDTPVSQTSGAAASASTGQAATAASAGDFLADLKESAGQAQPATDATPPQSVRTPQFAAAPPPVRKAAPASASDAPSAGTKTTVSAQKNDANATALTRLAANDQDAATGDDTSGTNAPPQQQAAPDATPAPSSATLSGSVNDTVNPAGGLQQPLQTNAAAPALALHVAPQGQASHAATTSDLDSLAINIAAKSLDGIKHFDIRLDPPELGRVEVRLSVDDSGKAQASLSADRPQTLQLLQNDASNLNRALKDAGLNLSDSGLSFSLRGQDRQANDNQASQQQRGRSLSVRAQLSIDAASQVSTNAYAALSPDSAGVDIRV